MAHIKPASSSPPLVAIQMWSMLIASLSCCAPLLPHLPSWLSGLCLLLLLWYGVLLWRNTPLKQYPKRIVLIALALGGAIAIGLHFQTLFGRSPGVALLAWLLLLKLLESRSQRDGYVAMWLACFLLMSLFFYAQDMASGTFMLLGVALISTTLALLNTPQQTPIHALRIVSRMLLQATPFMLVMFLLFPRIESPLWALPADALSGVTGLSDTMSPGGISQLSQSESIAFRAHFNGALEGRAPPQQQLYWRGPVLVDFDGRTWRASPNSSLVTAHVQLPNAPTAQSVGYSITLEPHNRLWLFALEWPVSMPQSLEAGLTFDYQLWAKQPVLGRIRYDLRSTLQPVTIARNEYRGLLAAALKLPADFNPRTRALATQWRKEAGQNDLAIVQRMLNYLHEEKFYYTLRPPLLGEDSIDDFLFSTRRGFCEHYASAFVFAMRAAGIPARVVTGYQGGELNPNDGTLIVRQSDAHAWAEVWLHDRGWQRVDPTAAVAPARVERDLLAALPAGEPLLMRAQLPWLHSFRLRWEAVSNTWNQWVIGYNPQRQRSFLAGLGLPSVDWTHLAAWFSGLCSALFLAYTAWALRHRHTRDPLVALWQKFSRKMAKHGVELARQPWEGPADYAQRITAKLNTMPDKTVLSSAAQEIVAHYIRLSYGKMDWTPDQRSLHLRELKRRIAQLP